MAKRDEVVELPKEEEKEMQSSMGLWYMKVIKYAMKSISLWPTWAFSSKVSVTEKIFRSYILTQASIILFGQIYFLGTNFRKLKFLMIAHVYITSFATSAAIVRIVLGNFNQFGVILTNFYNEFHLIHYKKKDEYYYKIFKMVERACNTCAVFMIMILIFGAVLFNVSPAYNNWQAGAFSSSRNANTTLDYSIFYSFPGVDLHQHFYPTTVYNYLLSFICSISLCAMDGTLAIMTFQMIGHLLLLSHSLQSISHPKERNGKEPLVYDDEGEREVRGMLKEVIGHYRQITDYCNSIEKFFGPLLAFNYFMHSVCCCMLMIACSSTEPNIIMRYGPLTVLIFSQLLQMSAIFEVVCYVSEKLTDEIYCVPWQYMGRGNRVAVALLLQRSQTPIRFTAMGMVPVGVETMAKILKATFSTFTLLRYFKESD